MGFREHVLDLVAGSDIPVGNPMPAHLFFPFRRQSLTLSYLLHDGKGQFRVHPLSDQVDHDVISGTDGSGDRTDLVHDQILGIAQPYIRSVGKSRDADQV